MNKRPEITKELSLSLERYIEPDTAKRFVEDLTNLGGNDGKRKQY